MFRPVYSGILPDPRNSIDRAKDRIAGTVSALPVIPRITSGDWNDYKALPEAQSIPFEFDTFACTTFSGGHSIEEQIIWALKNGHVSQAITDRLKVLGFFKNQNDLSTFQISKRFNAILNGTTKRGNYFHRVADYYRNVGFIPDSMLPFNGETWEQYMNPEVITNDMILVAREMLSYFKIEYEFVPITTADGIDREEGELLQSLLECSPLQVAIPSPAVHAVVLQKLTTRKQYIFDTYEPFFYTKDINRPKIDYALRYLVTPLKAVPIELKRNLYIGMKGEDVAQVQRFLQINADGIFGQRTKDAIIAFQKRNGLVADGIFGEKSREKMRELL